LPKGKTIYEGEPISFKEMTGYAAGVKKRCATSTIEEFPKKIEAFDVMAQQASAEPTAC